MSMINPPWMDSENQICPEFLVHAESMLIVLVSDESARGTSIGAFLDKAMLDYFLKNENAFKAWVPELFLKKKKLSYRIFGGELASAQIACWLADLSLSPGKSLVVTEPTPFQYHPKENRVRKQKAPPVLTHPKKKTRVLVVDDSETIRKLLKRILSEDPDLECVGTVELPSQVMQAIEDLRPDVLTLDIHMPEMDGITLLKKILPKFPLPVVMISSLSREEGAFVLDALEAGAVDYIQKPSFDQLKTLAPLICEKVKNARWAKLSFKKTRSKLKTEKSNFEIGEIDLSYLIGIGASTGGTEALKEVLTALPQTIPPILIVQHIPPIFSKSFADRMNQLCAFEVREAKDGDAVVPNLVLIAPGGQQMRVLDRNGSLKIRIEDTEPVNRHKPSVDVLFDSMALLPSKKMVAAILTGMGADGARGLLKLRQKGLMTIGQDEASCVVYGMPKEAAKLGGVEKVLSLELIGRELLLGCAKATRRAS